MCENRGTKDRFEMGLRPKKAEESRWCEYASRGSEGSGNAYRSFGMLDIGQTVQKGEDTIGERR